MRFLSILIFLFIILPVLELITFATIGASIGVPTTLLIILFTGILGVTLARRAGRQAWQQLRQALLAKRNPSQEALRGLIILLAGLTLLMPGFITDFLGLLLLIPPIQEIAIKLLINFFPQLENLDPAADAKSGNADEVKASQLIIEVTADDVKDADKEQ